MLEHIRYLESTFDIDYWSLRLRIREHINLARSGRLWPEFKCDQVE